TTSPSASTNRCSAGRARRLSPATGTEDGAMVQGRSLWVLMLGAELLCAGCGGDGPRVVAVSGVVTRGGQPVPHLYLTFEPEHGRPSWAVSDAKGRFTLHYDRHQDGAAVGKHRVSVAFKPRDPGEEEDFRTGKKQAPKELKAILQKYGKI